MSSKKFSAYISQVAKSGASMTGMDENCDECVYNDGKTPDGILY